MINKALSLKITSTYLEEEMSLEQQPSSEMEVGFEGNQMLDEEQINFPVLDGNHIGKNRR